MKIYADTSILFSLYVTDANSPPADAWRQAKPVPLEFTGLHRLELRNTFGLAAFQQRLTPAESLAAWQEIEQDLAAGLLIAKPGLWEKLVPEAQQLAQQPAHPRWVARAWTFCVWRPRWYRALPIFAHSTCAKASGLNSRV